MYKETLWCIKKHTLKYLLIISYVKSLSTHQFINHVAAKVKDPELNQRTEGTWKVLQEVLAQFKTFEARQTGTSQTKIHNPLIYLFRADKPDIYFIYFICLFNLFTYLNQNIFISFVSLLTAKINVFIYLIHLFIYS